MIKSLFLNYQIIEGKKKKKKRRVLPIERENNENIIKNTIINNILVPLQINNKHDIHYKILHYTKKKKCYIHNIFTIFSQQIIGG